MRRLLVIALLFSWTAATADAAVLPVNATLSFTISTIGTVSLTGSGIGDSAGGIGSTAAIPAGLISATGSSVPISPPLLNLTLITVPVLSHGAATFSPNGALAHNAIANFFFTNGFPGGSVPLFPVGGGGTATAVLAGIPITVIGATFSNLGLTTANPTVVTMITGTEAGNPITVTATAFDNRTAGGKGTVQLVAPSSAVLAMGALGSLPVIGTLTLQFVPEPGTLLLVGAGIAGLTAFGRSRRRN